MKEQALLHRQGKVEAEKVHDQEDEEECLTCSA